MKQLKKVVEEYLERIGRLQEVQLGLGGKQSVKKEDNILLSQLLSKQVKSNEYILILAILLLCVTYLIASFFLLSHRDDASTTKIVSGSAFLLILEIVRRLRQLWIEKNVLDISLIMLRQLPPDQAANFINVLYWTFIRRSSKRMEMPDDKEIPR